ncbi:DUF503 domain-containing protein [Isosphaeraceae bacterium EP7]
MNVITLRLVLLATDCRSAREKRKRIRAILDRLHQSFNVSVAEVDRLDHPQESVIGVVVVAATRREARETLARVTDAVAAHPRAEILDQDTFEA